MNYRFVPASALFAAALMACSDPSSPSRATAPDLDLRLGKTVTPSNTTATVKVPLAADAFSVRSDGKFSDGTYSVYADGVCGITATIFLTGSGDMVMDGETRDMPIRDASATRVKCPFSIPTVRLRSSPEWKSRFRSSRPRRM